MDGRVECSDPADDAAKHLTAQTARFEALPDDGWLTLVLDEPVTIMRVADIKLDEYCCAMAIAAWGTATCFSTGPPFARPIRRWSSC